MEVFNLEQKDFTDFKNNDSTLLLSQLVSPVEKMNDDKLYQVRQTENMTNRDGEIIGSVIICFKVKNNQLIVTDQEPDEILELDFTKK